VYLGNFRYRRTVAQVDADAVQQVATMCASETSNADHIGLCPMAAEHRLPLPWVGHNIQLAATM
jgi:hypothetical protein